LKVVGRGCHPPQGSATNTSQVGLASVMMLLLLLLLLQLLLLLLLLLQLLRGLL